MNEPRSLARRIHENCLVRAIIWPFKWLIIMPLIFTVMLIFAIICGVLGLLAFIGLLFGIPLTLVFGLGLLLVIPSILILLVAGIFYILTDLVNSLGDLVYKYM